MGKYAPLRRWLEQQPSGTTELKVSFVEVERVIGAPLPPSARRYQMWWNDDAGHTQAHAWLGAGWDVTQVWLTEEQVLFQRQGGQIHRNQPAPKKTSSAPAQQPARPGTVGTVALVACTKRKRSVPAPARDLYTSDWFVGARAYAERHADRWFILSSKYGLIEPGGVIQPYEQDLGSLSEDERRAWAKRVMANLQATLVPGERVIMLAGRNYRDPLMLPLQQRGHQVDVPMAGLPYLDQVRWLAERTQPKQDEPFSDVERFYGLLQDLEGRLGGKRLFGRAHGGMGWPQRGVYFFFEPSEYRNTDIATLRVVRVGTHALTAGTRSTLWTRLSQHQGPPNGEGNHRASVFRLHAGAALLARAGTTNTLPSWGRGTSAGSEVRHQERGHERDVTRILGRMPFLWLPVGDEAGPGSDRAFIERNAIALLSSSGRETDPPSEVWLGRWSNSGAIRASGMWNVRHVGEPYDPAFLEVMQSYVRAVP